MDGESVAEAGSEHGDDLRLPVEDPGDMGEVLRVEHGVQRLTVVAAAFGFTADAAGGGPELEFSEYNWALNEAPKS